MGLVIVIALHRLHKCRPSGHRQGYIFALNPLPKDLIEKVVRDTVLPGKIKAG